MTKNILVFSDGTGQAGGVRPDQRLSNVYKLYRAMRIGPDSPINPSEQVTFYDAGLGTDDNVGGGFLKGVTFIKKLLSAATGRGITKNITACYEAILNAYEPGDRIFLFGFSRGAYTARCIAGVLALCGIPTLGKDGRSLPKYRTETRSIADEAVRKVYEHGAGRERAKFEAERNELARRFRDRYQSDLGGRANVSPYFIGVFDTVASLGARGFLRALLILGFALAACAAALAMGAVLHRALGVSVAFGSLLSGAGIAAAAIVGAARSTVKVIRDYPEKGQFRWHIAKWDMRNYDRGLDSQVRFARHALAIDETRADFPRVQWGFRHSLHEALPGDPEFLRQIWFAGNHSDIGGSYPEEESRLSDNSLVWMLEELKTLPDAPAIDSSKLNIFPSPGGMQHCEVDALRDHIGGLLPSWAPKRFRFSWKEALRVEVLGAPVHPSVDERFNLPSVLQLGRQAPYRPKALREDTRYKHLY